MAIFRKNIWLLFFLFLVLSFLFLVVLSTFRWQSLTTHYELSQQGLVRQWFSGYSSLLEQQEAIITLIGEDILQYRQTGEGDPQARLDELMNLNPALFSGFALVSPQGDVLELTSNLSSDKLPQLMQLPQTRDTFSYALNTTRMVIGRTYFAPRLVVPARKAIRNKDGDVLGVMTGALRADSKDGFFAQNNVLGPFNRITILRSRDRYLQYATNGTLVDQFHTQPMSEVAYREFLSALRKGAGGNIDKALESGEPVSFQRKTATRGAVQGVALYNPRYEFWLISEIEERFLLRKFLESLAAYSLILVALQIFMYMAFRHIDKVEGKRRDELRFQATHDTLTQLPNRNYLIKRFPVWKREKEEFSLLFIDLDSFKGINDNFGHSTGDKILVELAKRFRSIVGEHELLVRHGGDEFVLLTGGVPLSENEDRVRRSIYDACENITVEGRRFSPGCSVGIARQPHHGTHLDELLRAADIAMYEAKKLRNTAQVFRPALEHKYLHRIRIEQRLRGATKRGEIHMNYQPQIDAEGQLYDVESLVRWHSPELGIVPPNEFVHIAEQSGRMGVLGDYIIDRTLREMGALARRYHQEFRVSINISVRQFEDHEFVQRLLEKTHAHGIPAHRLCLELTENLLIEDTDRIQKMLQALHGEGIQIALDDFGTGYSSLSMLRHLPLDEIKIDKSFIDDILEDETALTMVRNIISIARNYRTTILAEGVETYEQLQILKACGCNHFQGYYFSRPLALAALEDYVTQP